MLPSLDFFFFCFHLSGEIPDLYIIVQTYLNIQENISLYSTLKGKKKKPNDVASVQGKSKSTYIKKKDLPITSAGAIVRTPPSAHASASPTND